MFKTTYHKISVIEGFYSHRGFTVIEGLQPLVQTHEDCKFTYLLYMTHT